MRRPISDLLQARFTEEQASARQLIGAAKFDTADNKSGMLLRLGAEREGCIIDRKGVRHLCGDKVVAKVDKPWCTREFAKCVVEMTADAFTVGPNVFEQLFDQLLERRAIVAEAIAEHGAILGDFGLLASFGCTDMHSGEEIVSPLARYRSLLSYLGRRNGCYDIRLNGLEGELKIGVPASPVPAGLTAGFSPNVQFHPSFIGLALDLTTATAWTNPLIASSSPLAVETVGEWDSRVPFWQYGMDPERKLSPFGPGRYLNCPGGEALLDWMTMVGDGELVLTFEEAGIDLTAEGFPVLRLLTGTRWVQTGRLRGTVKEGRLCLHFENRLPDTGLTVLDDVANAAFYVGLIAALLRQVASADELISYADAEQAFAECVRTGDCEMHIRWRGVLQPAGKLLLETFIPLAYEGLVAEGIEGPVAQGLLEVVARRLRKKQTAAHWLLARMHRNQHGTNRADAVRLTLAEAAHVQSRQETVFTRFEGVADW